MIDDSLKETINDWFQYREVCDDDKFPVYFRRVLNRDYARYSQLLRLEPGVAEYDWLVEIYNEFKSQSITDSKNSSTKNLTTNYGEVIKTDTTKDHSGSVSHSHVQLESENYDSRSINSDTSTSNTQISRALPASNYDETVETGTVKNTGSNTRTDNLSQATDNTNTVTNDLTETSKSTNTRTNALKTEVNSNTTRTDDLASSSSASNTRTDNLKQSTSGSSTRTDNLSEESTSKSIRTDNTKTKVDSTDSTLHKQSTRTNNRELTKVNPQSISYTAAEVDDSATDGTGVPGLNWQYPSTQSQTVEDVTYIGNSPDTVTTDSTTTNTGTVDDDVTSSRTNTGTQGDVTSGETTNTGTVSSSSSGNTTNTGTVKNTGNSTQDDTGTVTDDGSITKTNTGTSTTKTGGSVTNTGTQATETSDSSETSNNNKVSHSVDSTVKNDGTNNVVSSDKVGFNRNETSTDTYDEHSPGSEITTHSGSDGVEDNGSETLNSTVTNYNINTGRNGEIAAILARAVGFIQATNAWEWLQSRLEVCFFGVYEV